MLGYNIYFMKTLKQPDTEGRLPYKMVKQLILKCIEYKSISKGNEKYTDVIKWQDHLQYLLSTTLSQLPQDELQTVVFDSNRLIEIMIEIGVAKK